jgi:predicted methyltransferase
MTRFLTLTVAIPAIALAGCSKAADTATSESHFSQSALNSALADPGRKDHGAADDARRKPGPLIALAGVKPGDKVVDLIPGSGYWTRIFSKVVGPTGKVYAIWPEAYAKEASGDVAKMQELAAGSYYGNIVVQVEPTAALTTPEPVDVVWTSQNYHDYPDKFMGSNDPSVLNRAAFKILKPGGTFFIIDHSAKRGRGLADTDTLHRIDPEVVKQEVEAAGFNFAGNSDVLVNPDDPLDIPVFDKSIRGHTSQFAFKFVKPAN